MPSDTQIIYSMIRVGRIHPPNKQVLRDISLGFYYGAKIGVLDLNGADNVIPSFITRSSGHAAGYLP